MIAPPSWDTVSNFLIAAGVGLMALIASPWQRRKGDAEAKAKAAEAIDEIAAAATKMVNLSQDQMDRVMARLVVVETELVTVRAENVEFRARIAQLERENSRLREERPD